MKFVSDANCFGLFASIDEIQEVCYFMEKNFEEQFDIFDEMALLGCRNDMVKFVMLILSQVRYMKECLQKK